MNSDELNATTERIIGAAFQVANTLGTGFLEKVYENALAYEMRKRGLVVEQQKCIDVLYDGHRVGTYIADLVVEGCVLVELKVAKALDEIHMARCLNYLKATGLPLALLFNFGTAKIQIQRIVRKA